MGFLRSIVVTLGGNLITGLGSVILAIVISRQLGPEGKGILTFFIVIVTLASMVADSGISIANVFFHKARNISEQILFWNGVLWSAVVGSLVGFLSLIAVIVLGYSEGRDWFFLVFAFGCTPLNIYISLQGQLLLGIGKVNRYNVSCIIQPIAILLIMLFFFQFFGPSIKLAMLSYVLGLLIVAVVQWMAVGAGRVKMSIGTLLSSLRYGFVGHLGTIAQFCNYRLDVIILGVLMGDEAVGIYSVSFTLGEVLWRLPRAVGMILYPKISGCTSVEATNLTVKVFKLSNLILLIVGLPFACVAALSIPLMFGNSFIESIVPFFVLLPGVFFFSWNNILVEDLKGRGVPIVKFYIASSALVLTIALDLILIPAFGVVGAAAASSVAYSVSGFISVFIYVRYVGVKFYDFLLITKSDVVSWWNMIVLYRKNKNI